jgi:hypothetical protein
MIYEMKKKRIIKKRLISNGERKTIGMQQRPEVEKLPRADRPWLLL